MEAVWPKTETEIATDRHGMEHCYDYDDENNEKSEEKKKEKR